MHFCVVRDRFVKLYMGLVCIFSPISDDPTQYTQFWLGVYFQPKTQWSHPVHFTWTWCVISVQDAVITPHTLNFMNKLVSTFGVGIENVNSVSSTYSSAASESLARRAQATAQDPVFQKMKSQFTTDFDFK